MSTVIVHFWLVSDVYDACRRVVTLPRYRGYVSVNVNSVSKRSQEGQWLRRGSERILTVTVGCEKENEYTVNRQKYMSCS